MSDQFNQSLIDGNRPYWVWSPLIFTGFYFLPMIFNSQFFSVNKIAVSVIVYLCFIYLYFKAANAKGERVLPIVVLMITLCVAATYITPGTQALFGFIAFFCGFNFTAKKAAAGLLVIIIAVLLAAFSFNFLDWYFIAPPLIISTALLFMGQAERKDRLHAQQQQVSQTAIEQLATIAERERISRDLHDVIGHSLTSIALKAELAEKYLDRNNDTLAQAEIKQVAELSRDILSQVRQAISGLKQQNFAAQLSQLQHNLTHHGFKVQLTNSCEQLSPQNESCLLLILTEAVTNILKHSQGDTVDIHLSSAQQTVSVLIADNGQVDSFTVGNGLDGITQRCEQLSGRCVIDHQQGFRITITLPEGVDD